MTSARFVSPRSQVIMGAILLAALSRLIPHPPNFTPMTAIGLFGAATLADRRLAIAIPLVSLLLSDLCIEFLYRMGLTTSWGIHSGMWVIYSTFLLITLMGFLLRERRNTFSIAGMTLTGSVVFFVVTNFAVWFRGQLYPQTVGGLMACYHAAVPFFQNAVLGDAFYSTLLFGAFALVDKRLPGPANSIPVNASA